MAIRKAIGLVKDQTSISLAKVAGSAATDLEILVLKATSHDNEPADERHVRQILNVLSHSKGYLQASVYAVSKRLSKTRDWIVALKALMLVHHLLNEGDPEFAQDLVLSTRKGMRVVNMSDFRDDAHSNSWDHTRFVRSYSVYLDQKLELLVSESGSRVDRMSRSHGSLNELEPGRVLERLNMKLQLLDRFSACKPNQAAENTRLVLMAVELLLKDSFRLYSDVSDELKYLFDCFLDLDYADSVRVFDVYVDASKSLEELFGLYIWCKDAEVLKPFDFPDVQRISDELLGNLEALLREKRNQHSNETKALPPPENQHPKKCLDQKDTAEFVDLKTDAISELEETNKLALALFSPPASPCKTSKWVDFSVETETANWELALVESTSKFSSHDADLGGGFDSLILNGIYDQGTVTQHMNNAHLSSGSASSVALPGTKKLLALPAPDGSVHPLDPFAASLSVPPPAYVQIAEMERKQQLLSYEQMVWQKYAENGMQGQMGLAEVAAGYGPGCPQYGMPQFTGLEQPGVYHHYL